METQPAAAEVPAVDPDELARRGWGVLNRYGFGEWGEVELVSPGGPGHDGKVQVMTLDTTLRECEGFVRGLEAIHEMAAEGIVTGDQAQQTLHTTLIRHMVIDQPAA